MTVPQGDDDRSRAIRRLYAKRGFRIHATVYVVASLGMILIWVLTSRGYFWPAWPIGGWAIGLFFHWWGVFGISPITEDDIRKEIRRSSGTND
ncbi:MAG TPA: 2TM domain-containing protein [Actinomycetota bacterium]|nr:2TM domain-containing protein [Actinomycetota bacterium]